MLAVSPVRVVLLKLTGITRPRRRPAARCARNGRAAVADKEARAGVDVGAASALWDCACAHVREGVRARLGSVSARVASA